MIPCRKTEKAPALDNPRDPVWGSVIPFKRFCDMAYGVEEGISMRMLRDEKNLYALFEIGLDVTPQVLAKERDGAVWKDDSVEFFLKSGNGPVRQVVVNRNGVMLDSSEGDIKWNCDFQAHAGKLEKGWYAAVRIPLEIFGGTPVEASPMRVNAIVNIPFYSMSHRVRYAPVPMIGSNFDFSRYGKVLFLK